MASIPPVLCRAYRIRRIVRHISRVQRDPGQIAGIIRYLNRLVHMGQRPDDHAPTGHTGQ